MVHVPSLKTDGKWIISWDQIAFVLFVQSWRWSERGMFCRRCCAGQEGWTMDNNASGRSNFQVPCKYDELMARQLCHAINIVLDCMALQSVCVYCVLCNFHYWCLATWISFCFFLSSCVKTVQHTKAKVILLSKWMTCSSSVISNANAIDQF